jgi:hypothetical protein
MAEDPRARWAAFLEKIEARHGELLAGAREALPGLVPDSGYELTPFSNALTAVRTQCIGLSQKIGNTWSQSAGAAIEGAGLGSNAERAKGDACASRMAIALRRAEVEISAAAADVVCERAKQTLARDFKCTRCGAPLSPKQSFFRAHYVPCQFCQSMNTFEPGMVARQVEHFAVHALAERAALGKNLAFLEGEERFRERHSTVSKEALISLYESYVDAYLAEKVRLLPDLAADLERDRHAKVSAFVYSVA